MAKPTTTSGFANPALTRRQKAILLSGACLFAFSFAGDADAARRKLIPELPSIEVHFEAVDRLNVSAEDAMRGEGGLKWQTGAPAIITPSPTPATSPQPAPLVATTAPAPTFTPVTIAPAEVTTSKNRIIAPITPNADMSADKMRAPTPTTPIQKPLPMPAPAIEKPLPIADAPAPEPLPTIPLAPPAPATQEHAAQPLPPAAMTMQDVPVMPPMAAEAEVTPQNSSGFNNLSESERVAPKTTIEASVPTSPQTPTPSLTPPPPTNSDNKAFRRPINIQVPDTTDSANPAPSRYTAAITGEAEVVPAPPPPIKTQEPPKDILAAPSNSPFDAVSSEPNTASQDKAVSAISSSKSAKKDAPAAKLEPEPEARINVNKDVPELPDVPERIGASPTLHPSDMKKPREAAKETKKITEASKKQDAKKKKVDDKVLDDHTEDKKSAEKHKPALTLKDLEHDRKAVTEKTPEPSKAPEKDAAITSVMPPMPLPSVEKPTTVAPIPDLPTPPITKSIEDKDALPSLPLPPTVKPSDATKAPTPTMPPLKAEEDNIPALPSLPTKQIQATTPPPVTPALKEDALPSLPLPPTGKPDNTTSHPVPPAAPPALSAIKEDEVKDPLAPKLPTTSEPKKEDGGWLSGLKDKASGMLGGKKPEPEASKRPAIDDEDAPPSLPPAGKAPDAIKPVSPAPNAAPKEDEDALPSLPLPPAGKAPDAIKPVSPAPNAAPKEDEDALPSLPLPPAGKLPKTPEAPVVLDTPSKLPPLPSATKLSAKNEDEDLPLPPAKPALPSPDLLKTSGAASTDNRALDIARRHTSAPLPSVPTPTPPASTSKTKDDEDLPALPPLPSITGKTFNKIEVKPESKDKEEAPFGKAQPIAKGPAKPVPAPTIGTVEDEDLPPLPQLSKPTPASSALPVAAPPAAPVVAVIPKDDDSTSPAHADKQAAASPPVVGKISGSVIFAAQDTALSKEEEGKLVGLAKQLASSKQNISIFAYASGTADQASIARRVSLARALAVRAYLIEQGVDGLSINVQAKGNQTNVDRVDISVKDGK